MRAIVHYDYQGNGLHPASTVPFSGSKILGLDYFHSAVMVRLWNKPGLYALPALKQLPRLREIQYGFGTLGDQEIVDTLRAELPGVKIVVYNAAVG